MHSSKRMGSRSHMAISPEHIDYLCDSFVLPPGCEHLEDPLRILFRALLTQTNRSVLMLPTGCAASPTPTQPYSQESGHEFN